MVNDIDERETDVNSYPVKEDRPVRAATAVLTAAEAAAKIDERSWGPVDDDDTVIINLPDAKHSWVKVKAYITEADDAAASQAAIARGITMGVAATATRAQRRAAGQRGQAADTENTYHFDAAAQRAVLLQRMIRDWSFKSRDGAPIPITARSIGALPLHTRDFIMEKLDDLNPKADVPDDEDDEELDQHGQNTGPLGVHTNGSS